MFRRLWQGIRPPKLMVWITPELALGPAPTKEQVVLLAKAGIGSIVDLREEASDDEAELTKYGMHFLHLPVEDFRAPTQEQLKAAGDWTLAEFAAGRKVYVHCRSGIGRSPCVACAVLMAIGFSLPEAYAAMHRQRPWATLSDSQQAALEEFDASLRQRAAEAEG